MTRRERIANWISGGALTEARADVARQYARAQAYQDELHAAQEDLTLSTRVLAAHQRSAHEAQERLARIAALETPNCAHVGKKMAAIARGEA